MQGTRLTTVFPLYWRYERPDETTHVLLNLLFSSGMTPRGPSWAFHLFPLVDVVSYHPEHLLWQMLGGAAGCERQGDNRRYRVVWIWTDPHAGHVRSSGVRGCVIPPRGERSCSGPT